MDRDDAHRQDGGDPSASWHALEAAIARDEQGAARMRSWSTPVRRSVGVALIVTVPLLVWLVRPRPDHETYPLVRWILECVALVVVIGWASAIALRPMHRPDPGRTARWVALGGALVSVVLASLPAVETSFAISSGDALAQAPLCFLFGTACAVPTWLGLRMLARDGDRLGARADVVAAASAGVGAFAVYLHCPIVAHEHLWLGHVAILALPWLWALRLSRATA